MISDRMTRRRALAALGATALAPLAACTGRESAPSTAATAVSLENAHWMGLQEISRMIASRAVSPVALTQHMFDRIRQVDASLKSYATLMEDQAMSAATEAEREIKAGKYRGALHGVPVAVKDLCYTRGVRTTGGTRVLRDFVPDQDATVVTKIQSAGAIVLGKLNLTEGAAAGYNPERGIPVNPWNASRWPGASSSGSGVATAAGLCFAAIGTDTGGSIRFPASANGLVGLKPTYGRVSRHGVLALSPSLDHVGPMGRRVADVAILFDAIAGHDPKDSTSLADPPASALAAVGQGVEGLRIGIDRSHASTNIDPGQVASIEAALHVLEGLGARIVDVKMPDLAAMLNMWFAICATEALAEHKANYPSRAAEYGLYFRDFLATGAAMTPAQVAGAQAWRAKFTAGFNALLESVDVMACPAGGAAAWPVTRELMLSPMAELNGTWEKVSPRAAEFTMPMNLAGTPAICLPSGFSPDGLPYSIQFAGRRLSEPMLCRVAGAYERATKWHERHPEV
jgi:amidase